MRLYEREILRKLKIQLLKDPFSYEDYLNGCREFLGGSVETYYRDFVDECPDKRVRWNLVTIKANEWVCDQFEKEST